MAAPVEPEIKAVAEQDKQALCCEILVNGHVQAFVDFFYLTHRPEAAGAGAPTSGREGRADDHLNVPAAKLPYIQQRLTEAEVGRRQGDTRGVFSSYQQLACLFADEIADHRTAVYFWEKCLEIARLTSNGEYEVEATRALGIAHEALGDVKLALTFYQKLQRLTSDAQTEESEKQAWVLLHNANVVLAEAATAAGELREALELRQTCLQTAEAAGDRGMIGRAHYEMGQAHERLRDVDELLKVSGPHPLDLNPHCATSQPSSAGRREPGLTHATVHSQMHTTYAPSRRMKRTWMSFSRRAFGQATPRAPSLFLSRAPSACLSVILGLPPSLFPLSPLPPSHIHAAARTHNTTQHASGGTRSTKVHTTGEACTGGDNPLSCTGRHLPVPTLPTIATSFPCPTRPHPHLLLLLQAITHYKLYLSFSVKSPATRSGTHPPPLPHPQSHPPPSSLLLQAITHYKPYLSLCEESGDEVGQGAACFALAQAYQRLDNTSQSQAYLRRFLEAATASGKLAMQAEACCSLGVLYNAQASLRRDASAKPSVLFYTSVLL
jgi:tetratricopeptide (TPR) repeat protein